MRRRSLLSAVHLLPAWAFAQAPAAPLVEAAGRGDLPQVRNLIEGGTPVEQRDARGRTAVLAAAEGNHLEVVRLLIARGADVNAKDAQQDSAFLIACARGHTAVVRATLEAGADLASTNRYGGTGLIPACHYGHVETVRLLLATRIDVDHVNHLGWTALLEAVILGDGGNAHARIVQMLIQRGANVNLADRQGVTPLQHARQRQQVRVAQLLALAGGQ